MPVHKCPDGKYRIGSGKCMFESKAKAELAYKAYLVKEHKNEIGDYKKLLNNLIVIEEQINKEREEIWKFQEFVPSLRSVVSYIETGDPYPEEMM